MQEGEENVEYDPEALLAMPAEVLANLFGRMAFEDVVRYCAVHPTLRDICSRRGLLEARARQYVQEWAPISSPVTNNIDHAILIARGFVTQYNYNTTTGKVQFGSYTVDSNSFNFNIIGLPPAKGTRVHLISNVHWDPDSSGWAVPYLSIEDIYADMKWAYHSERGQILVPPTVLYDRTTDSGGIIGLVGPVEDGREDRTEAEINARLRRGLDELIANGEVGMVSYSVVELP